eukprot:435813-Hanusia_phi.AAC.1
MVGIKIFIALGSHGRKRKKTRSHTHKHTNTHRKFFSTEQRKRNREAVGRLPSRLRQAAYRRESDKSPDPIALRGSERPRHVRSDSPGALRPWLPRLFFAFFAAAARCGYSIGGSGLERELQAEPLGE